MKRITSLFVCLMLIGSFALHAQDIQIRGTVTGDDGEPLPGVSVVIKGTKTGMATDINGEYSLSVPTGAILVFSAVGMKSQEIAIAGQSVINVTLESEAIGLDEVVVTALGITREKKALGYATSVVSSEEISGSGEYNIIEALAAKASGVQVIGSGGTPGASSKILIRGNSSFTGNNQPLIIIDGIPIDNTTDQTSAGDNPYNKNLEGVNNANRALDINPDDIQTVTILKGPAAAALYGVRAANGAILYTTKKGTQGQIKATYEYKFELAQVNKLPEWQSTYSQGEGGAFSSSGYRSWGARMSDLGITPADNVEEFFENSYSHTHNVSVTGGNEVSNYRVAFGNLNNNGIIPNTFLDRTNVRLTGETSVSENLKVGGTANYTKTKGNFGQNGSNLAGLMLALFRAPENYNLNDPVEGGYETPDGQQRTYFAAFDNPYWSTYNNTFVSNVDRIMGNFYGNYSLNWLTLDYKLGTDFYTDARKGIIALNSNGGDAGDGLGEVTENIIRNRELTSIFMASVNHQIGEIKGNLSLGHNFNEQYYQNLFGRSRVLSAPDFYNLNNGSDLYTDESSTTVRTSAIFIIADLDWKSTLFLNATGRNEWASTLGSNKNNFFYPSVSASFIFTELLPENSVLTFGKLRLGWAKAGNNPSAYGTLTYYTQPNVAAGMTGGLGWPYLEQSGFSKSTILGNSELMPEMTTGIEGGLDLRFFNGRLNLDVTYYNQKTVDILVQRPIAPSTGYAAIYENSGEMLNQGIELTLSGSPIKTSSFSWDIMVNFTINQNEVLKLAEGVDEISIESAFYSMGSYAIVGKPYGALYSDMWLRDANGKMVVDEFGYPIIADERGNVGNPFPDWLSNVRNTLTYKSLSLSFLIDIRKGGEIWNGTIARLNQIGRTDITADREGTIVVDGVTETGTPNTVEIPLEDYYTYVVGDWGPGENAVYDGSWVRLRDLSLKYRYGINNSSKLGKYIKAISFTASGRNLWLSTDYPGIDPETSLTGAGSNLTGFDYFNMPGSKSYIFGIKVDF
ncbi:MAG: SusC/RagA family TonB-linked outer membrane protein [Bacteroidales bacterium]